ncbi:helix-turn-helix transcriptional regulator [Anaerolineales bacterium HSG24]|nr:helix-turn-helix transcriptional regulator [Anaerolineales bacterium HSG24]
MSQFGEKLRFLRTSKGITLRDLANAVDASYGYIARIERGESIPTVTIAYKIAQFFDVLLDDLANDDVELS